MGNERKQQEERTSAKAPTDKGPSYIVAVGGSAGGLEAFERFFAGIPPDTGMAFVIIQHLAPAHKALMPELLQRSIEMPVREIEDGVMVEPNHIYVIPPNADLSISDGHLHLSKPSAPHGQRLPIDSFFQSLAAERGDKSIAVIVSGMGTDGTLGLKAIKDVSGVVLVESPGSAKFSGMPKSAVSTGQVDCVAPIDELPKELIAYVNHVSGQIPFQVPFVETPAFENLASDPTLDVKEALGRTLLERYAPPSVVVTAGGDIVLVSGRTGKYLEPAEGTANWNISAMAREGLRLELPGAILRSATLKTAVSLDGLNVKTNGDYQKVDVTVSPLMQPGGCIELFVVTFDDVLATETAHAIIGASDKPDARYKKLEKELACAKERLQSTLEEIEATSEELRSANDEMQATNEELQSTNEELTTSQEELQSLNEELNTLNAQLQSKIDDATALKSDIVNLMNSTQLATIFLDGEMRIKGFTPAVVGTFNLRSIDVGRPITDITQNLLYDAIEQDVRSVLDTLTTHELQVQSTDGRWFIMRIMPYRTLDDVIDGVVITFSDVTQLKDLEVALLRSRILSRALNVIHTEISSSLDSDDVMRAVVAKAAEAIGVDLGMITICEDDQWVVRYLSNEDRLHPGLRFTAKQAPYLALISKTTEPTVINDTTQDAGICSELCEQYGMRSVLGIPLITGKEVLGVLSLVSTSELVSFTDADADFAHKLGLAVSLALTASRLYMAERQAKLDAEVVRRLLVEDHSMLQKALLPDEPHITSGYHLATRFIPGTAGKQVGGDFYDVFETEDGMTAILIGDVSGKGVKSAAMAAATRSTVRAFTYDLGDPAQALNHTNAVIDQSPTHERFATAFLAVLDPATGRLTYSSAGHPPAMVRRACGDVDLLNEGQVPIAVASGVDYVLHESRMAAGDQLVMYTDGISEARDGSEMLDIEGIKRTLESCSNCSPDQTLDALFETALDFSGGHLADDAAVVIIERCKE